MKLDYLNGTSYEIEQPAEMYHFNSDTELLGRFMRLKAEDIVLDIGCATGALLCYAAYQHPLDLYGIDLYQEVIEQAEKNLAQNAIQAHLSVCRAQEYQGGISFDVIVCNPPYFDTKKKELKNQNPYLSAARHESFLNLTDVFITADRLLKQDGVLYLVHRYERLDEILQTAQTYHFYPERMRTAYKTIGGAPSGVLLCFGKDAEHQVQMDAPVYLDDRRTFAPTKGEGR